MSFDAVIRVGGSLEATPELRPLMAELAGLAGQHRLLIVPGGAGFADTVRHSYRRHGLSEVAAHRMALLAMDQYGLLLADLAPRAAAVSWPAEAQELARAGRLPVLLPARVAWGLDQLECSWRVTSDAVAAWVAALVGAPLLLLLKDVDGILTADPRSCPGASLRPVVRAADLAAGQAGDGQPVDAAFAALLSSITRGWVVNGRHPERVRELLRSGRTVGTEVLA